MWIAGAFLIWCIEKIVYFCKVNSNVNKTISGNQAIVIGVHAHYSHPDWIRPVGVFILT